MLGRAITRNVPRDHHGRDTGRAMSQENVEIVRRIYEAWNAGDLGLQHFDPAVEVHQTAGFLDTGGVFHGHEGVLASARELMQGLHDLHWDTHDFIAARCSQVVVPFTARATAGLRRPQSR